MGHRPRWTAGVRAFTRWRHALPRGTHTAAAMRDAMLLQMPAAPKRVPTGSRVQRSARRRVTLFYWQTSVVGSHGPIIAVVGFAPLASNVSLTS